MSKEAMKQALEALESTHDVGCNKTDEAITSLRQAIAEAEKQEPVAYEIQQGDSFTLVYAEAVHKYKMVSEEAIVQPLYTHPQPKAEQTMMEHLSAVAGYFYDGPVRNLSVVSACEKAINKISGKEIYKTSIVQQTKLEDIEQYRLQMAGISTAAIGYWKEGDSIHPDYDTVALRDVAKLYAKYAELYDAQPKREPLTDEEIEVIAKKNDVWLLFRSLAIFDFVKDIEAAHGIKE